ncbi:hypothetical protein K505DRAFT_336641 [Melanomma pulvis-pyrius CBS 109.77]|uniref:Uncharacterized protein n=1 Tax=Melanomma pulvis-pyrius CBS 109.77 TaxID=1314802 RepID=A0A6A6XGH3_9PLEO|nr:hypothetical protein K505DRAFT_336641 [Melanomma pulvis-pyrius CBS 109.77]
MPPYTIFLVSILLALGNVSASSNAAEERSHARDLLKRAEYLRNVDDGPYVGTYRKGVGNGHNRIHSGCNLGGKSVCTLMPVSQNVPLTDFPFSIESQGWDTRFKRVDGSGPGKGFYCYVPNIDDSSENGPTQQITCYYPCNTFMLPASRIPIVSDRANQSGQSEEHLRSSQDRVWRQVNI